MKRLTSCALLISLCCAPCEAINWRKAAKTTGVSGITVAALAFVGWRLWPRVMEFYGPFPNRGNLHSLSDQWTSPDAHNLWRNEMIRLFGYDTLTNELQPASNTNKHTVVIFSHPFRRDYSIDRISTILGDQYGHVAHLNFKYRACLGFVEAHQFSFGEREFVETHWAKFVAQCALFRHLNLGGITEALVLARHVMLAVEKGYTKIILFGHSCGFARILTLMRMLSPAHRAEYEASWKKIGCVDRQGNLDNAKLDQMSQAIKHLVGAKPLMRRLNAYGQVAANQTFPALRKPGAHAIQLFLSACTDCSIFDKEPIDILKELRNQLPKTHITVARQDEIVTSEDNEKVQQILGNDQRFTYICEETDHASTETSQKHLQQIIGTLVAQQN